MRLLACLLLLSCTLAAADTDETLVMLRFSRTTNKGVQFTDAVILTDAEFKALTNAQIRDLKTARFQAWKNAVDNPPPPRTPKVEDKQDLADTATSLETTLTEMRDRQTVNKFRNMLDNLVTKLQEFKAGL